MPGPYTTMQLVGTIAGTVTLPDPTKVSRVHDPNGHLFKNADGSKTWQLFSTKRTWTIEWEYLTSAQITTLRNVWKINEVMTFTDWDGETGSVVPSIHSLDDSPYDYHAGDRWNCKAVLEEV